METALYRIVQESLTNVARHAQAHHVSIALKEKTDAVYATIIDDGRGFDQEQVQKLPSSGQERGWGLMGMHERAHLLDGDLTIDSNPGKGTTVRACLPLQETTSSKKETESEVSV
jgi:two-component system, NarL family, sensor histidine kinase UhpB